MICTVSVYLILTRQWMELKTFKSRKCEGKLIMQCLFFVFHSQHRINITLGLVKLSKNECWCKGNSVSRTTCTRRHWNNLDHVFVFVLASEPFSQWNKDFILSLACVCVFIVSEISRAIVLMGCMCFFSMVCYPQGVEQLIDALDSGTL